MPCAAGRPEPAVLRARGGEPNSGSCTPFEHTRVHDFCAQKTISLMTLPRNARLAFVPSSVSSRVYCIRSTGRAGCESCQTGPAWLGTRRPGAPSSCPVAPARATRRSSKSQHNIVLTHALSSLSASGTTVKVALRIAVTYPGDRTQAGFSIIISHQSSCFIVIACSFSPKG